MRNLKAISNQVESVILENQNNPAVKKLIESVQNMSTEKGDLTMQKITEALKSDAQNLLKSFEKKVTKKNILSIIEDNEKYQKFLTSNYFESSVKSYQEQIVHNKYLELLNREYNLPVKEAAARVRCSINGKSAPAWLCGVIIIIIIIIIILL
jgi:uncharacterized protein YjaZ